MGVAARPVLGTRPGRVVLHWGHASEGNGLMTHQGDRGAFDAAAWLAGARGGPVDGEERGDRAAERAGARRGPRAELNGEALRPCRPEGRLYE